MIQANSLVVPEVHPNLSIAFGGISEGNVDPRPKFDTSFEEVSSARRLLRQNLGLFDEDLVYALCLKGGMDLVDLAATSQDPRITANDTYPEIDVIGDAVITGQVRTGLMMGAADCMPLILFEPQKSVLSLVHIGWKGAVGRLHEKTLSYAKEQYGFSAEEAIAYLGPVVGQDNFRTEELHDAQANEDEWQPHIEEKDDGFYVDIEGFVLDGLERAGLHSENIIQSGIDTADPNSGMFSHERHKKEGVRSGRNGFLAVML